MKFTAAVILAAAAGASAHYGSNQTVVTEVVSSYVTYCPGPTEITHGENTYTVTEATTLTITDCPCTITKPVTTTSAVVCHTCVPEAPSQPPVLPPHQNTTVVPPPASGVPPPPPSTDVPPPPPANTPAPPPESGAGKAMALSGAGLAGVLALAAFL
jgi:hypothetical protein